MRRLEFALVVALEPTSSEREGRPLPTRALPLPGRLPLEFPLDFGFLFAMESDAEGAWIDGIAREGVRATGCLASGKSVR